MDYYTVKNEIIDTFTKHWDMNDAAHRETHFNNVEKCGRHINRTLDLGFDPIFIMYVAFFHDMFSWSRNNHHLMSAQWVRTTDHWIIRKYLTDEGRELVAIGCEEHRASRTEPFSCLFGELMNAADREEPGNVAGMLERAIQYRMARGMDRERAWQPSIDHIKEKFGVGGYALYPPLYELTYKEQLQQQREEIMEL